MARFRRKLATLDLAENDLLSGPIPSELGKLTELQYLNLQVNQLSGPIPGELGSLINLRYLELFHNQVSGSIPVELGMLANLDHLSMRENNLSGPIPVGLGNLTNLETLSLGGNTLSGMIPPELGNLTNLVYLWLSDNFLSGSIPAELANLNKLVGLGLSKNLLSGSIPAELGNMESLRGLGLGSNKLSGSIPASLSKLNISDPHWIYGWDLTLDWNALYAVDADLVVFLEAKAGSHWSSTQTVVPTMIGVSSVDSDSVTLDWSPIEYTRNEGGYRVWYGTTPDGPYLDGGITATKSSTSHTVTGLNPAQNYYFAVTTETDRHNRNRNNVVSEISKEVFVSTSLAKPTSVRATDGTFLGLVRVTFNLVEEATVYRVFRCLDTGQTCGSPIGYTTTGSFDDRNAVPGTVYYFRVRACIENACGKFSAANTGFASIQLPQPTGIMATDGTYTDRVHISWNGVDGASVYRVFRCLATGQTCGSPIGFPQGTSFDDRKGDSGTIYYYRVKACTTQNCSKFSVANAGHHKLNSITEDNEISAFMVPDQNVPIPTLSNPGRWLLMLGFGLVLVNRQYVTKAS